MSATVISTPISMTQSFLTQKYITFNKRNSDKKILHEYAVIVGMEQILKKIPNNEIRNILVLCFVISFIFPC